jgi:hypothetical protein
MINFTYCYNNTKNKIKLLDDDINGSSEKFNINKYYLRDERACLNWHHIFKFGMLEN